MSNLLLSQSPVLLDLSLPGFLVLLPPALGAQALPGSIAIVTAAFLTQQFWLVHMDPPSLRTLTHRVPFCLGKETGLTLWTEFAYPVCSTCCKTTAVRLHNVLCKDMQLMQNTSKMSTLLKTRQGVISIIWSSEQSWKWNYCEYQIFRL